MRAILGLAVVVVLVAIVAVWLGLLRVDQTRQARLPEVSGGQTPKFDVQTARVDVGTSRTTIDVPKVETEKKAIDLPKVTVDKPGR